MHLCNIPEDEILGLKIPNGLPLIHDITSKYVNLLDYKTGKDPLKVYNFRKTGNYLFKLSKKKAGTINEHACIQSWFMPIVLLA